MFTGLIEEIGTVKNINASNEGSVITIECKKILEDIKLGASICINGACHTVTEFTQTSFTTQTSLETLNVTTFGCLKKGDKVNLERAMLLSTRLDGHIVSGHIDGTAEFLRKEKEGFSNRFFFKLPVELSKQVVKKGSIAINGISLTVASIEDNIFSVEIIPTTIKETNLQSLQIADRVNIETDLFAKYINKYIENLFGVGDNNTTKITKDFLEANGFI